MGRRIFHEGKDFRIGNGARRLGCNKCECRNEARRDGLLPALQVVGDEGALAVIRQRPFMSPAVKASVGDSDPKQSRRRGGKVRLFNVGERLRYNGAVLQTGAYRPPVRASDLRALRMPRRTTDQICGRGLMRVKRYAPISRRLGCRRKEPLHSDQRSGRVDRRRSTPILRAGRDNFRDNLGTARFTVTQCQSYTQFLVAARPERAQRIEGPAPSELGIRRVEG